MAFLEAATKSGNSLLEKVDVAPGLLAQILNHKNNSF